VWRGERERLDKRGKSERGRIGSGEEEGKGWIREGKSEWVLDKEWRGGRERVDKRWKSERFCYGVMEEGKGWIREGKVKGVWLGSERRKGKGG
jgi:hypothetical protein